MADIYLYRGTPLQQELQLLIHMDVPAGNNAQNIPNATAILLSGYSSGKSLMPSGDGTNGTIDPVEREKLAIGTRHEFLTTFSTAVNGSVSQANIRTFRTSEVARVTAEIVQAIQNFGFSFT